MDKANKRKLEIGQLTEMQNADFLYSSDESEKSRQLIVYIEPVPKGRPRFTKRGHAYTPKKTADYEKKISDCWRWSFSDVMTGTLKISIDFYMPIPKSMSKADKQRAIEKELMPSKKPDLDNLTKAVLDALNEVAYWDDKQITKMRVAKWYSTEPRIEITITEI